MPSATLEGADVGDPECPWPPMLGLPEHVPRSARPRRREARASRSDRNEPTYAGSSSRGTGHDSGVGSGRPRSCRTTLAMRSRKNQGAPRTPAIAAFTSMVSVYGSPPQTPHAITRCSTRPLSTYVWQDGQ